MTEPAQAIRPDADVKLSLEAWEKNHRGKVDAASLKAKGYTV